MDRKNYFYPDCPKNYQITQGRYPLCKDGYIYIKLKNKRIKRIGIERIHIEEDAAKLIHSKFGTLVDCNRAGIPLIEIVSKPDIRSSEEAVLYLKKLKTILQYLGISDCKMEEGSLRCDGNISVKYKNSNKLGIKTEIKNVNSFKSLKKAIEYEYHRQINSIKSGFKINRETRKWDDKESKTLVMISKEYSNDYRYFPEGDLFPINISDEYIKKIKKSIPEMPYAKAKRFEKEYNLPKKYALSISSNIKIADFFENTVNICKKPKVVANWVIEEIYKLFSNNYKNVEKIRINPEDMAKFINLIVSKTVSSSSGKKIIKEMFYTGKDPNTIVKEKKLKQNNNEMEIYNIVKDVIARNQKSVKDYKNGKKRAAKFIVGSIMKETKGTVNPAIVNKLVISELNNKN